MSERKYDGAIMNKNGILHCPECKARLVINKDRGFTSGVIERKITKYAKCRCEFDNEDWQFIYILKGLEGD